MNYGSAVSDGKLISSRSVLLAVFAAVVLTAGIGFAVFSDSSDAETDGASTEEYVVADDSESTSDNDDIDRQIIALVLIIVLIGVIALLAHLAYHGKSD